VERGDAATEELFRAGRDAWPELEVTAASFTAFLRDHGENDAHAEAPRHAGDLYLACACAAGDPRALAAFERHFGDELTRALRRVGPVTEDLEQRVRELLFTHASGGPKIAQYAGHAPLRHWLRVVAARIAQNARRKRVEAPADDAILSAVVADAANPESSLISASLLHEYKTAFEEAFRALEPSERTLLRFSVVDELGIDAIAELLKVHRATAARRVASARARLGELTKAQVMARARLSEADFESAVHWIRSQLDLSLRRVFVDDGD
jgi:RNA polymerase sigma-70 factor (ECF subfamily)